MNPEIDDSQLWQAAREKVQMMHLRHSQLAQLCSLCQREAKEACQPLLGLKNQTNCAQGFSEQVSMSKNIVAKFRLIKKKRKKKIPASG